MNKTPSLLIPAVFAVLTVAVWAYANRSTPEPAWPAKVHGFAFQPFQKDQDAIAGDLPTVAGDRPRPHACWPARPRPCAPTASLGTLGEIPALAARHGLARHRRRVARQRPRAATSARSSARSSSPTATRTSPASSSATKSCCAATCRSATSSRTSTASAAATKQAGQHRRALARLDRASGARRARRLHRRAHAAVLGRRRRRGGGRLRRRQDASCSKQRFPGKPIVIGEVGWPSDGRTRESAVASHGEPGAVPAPLPRARRAARATPTT